MLFIKGNRFNLFLVLPTVYTYILHNVTVLFSPQEWTVMTWYLHRLKHSLPAHIWQCWVTSQAIELAREMKGSETYYLVFFATSGQTEQMGNNKHGHMWSWWFTMVPLSCESRSAEWHAPQGLTGNGLNTTARSSLNLKDLRRLGVEKKNSAGNSSALKVSIAGRLLLFYF